MARRGKWAREEDVPYISADRHGCHYAPWLHADSAKSEIEKIKNEAFQHRRRF
jgi:hypothetical protein